MINTRQEAVCTGKHAIWFSNHFFGLFAFDEAHKKIFRKIDVALISFPSI